MYNKFYILCPIYNFDKFIRQCLNSILDQNYSHWYCILFDDGSTDNSAYICKKYVEQYPTKFEYLQLSKKNNGPAYTKYHGLMHINKISDANDILLVVDGDDYLFTQEALSIINDTYQKTKCWCTYGSSHFTGEWEYRQQDIPRDPRLNSTGKGGNKINFRKLSWRFAHPRSCKCFLLTNFQKKDFQYQGLWLKKSTDRPLIYNMLEWSGISKVAFITSKIYFYREHNKNTWKLISSDYKKFINQYITNTPPKPKLYANIHIVLCMWKRIDNFDLIVNTLNNQTLAYTIHLHILNNNVDYVDNLEEKVKNFSRIKKNQIKISLSHYNNQYSCFQRFFYIRDVLLKKYLLDYVFIIDDDQYFNNYWVEFLYKQAVPNTFTTWYGKIFNRKHLNYWEDTLEICKYDLNQDMKYFNYGAPCGCIIDVSIFKKGSKLWQIPRELPRNLSVYEMDDLWLSFVITHHYNWKIKRSFLPPAQIYDETDFNSNTKEVALYSTLFNKKQLFLEYLVNTLKWNIGEKVLIKSTPANHNKRLPEQVRMKKIHKRSTSMQLIKSGPKLIKLNSRSKMNKMLVL